MKDRRSVAIIQEYVPTYRKRFFELLIEALDELDVDCHVLAGRPHGTQAARRDDSPATFVTRLEQKEFSLFSKRLVVSNAHRSTKNFDMVIFEQARRNIALYQALVHRRGQIIAMWGHGRDYTTNSGRMASRLLDALTLRCDWFFGYTQESVAHVTRAGFDSSKTTVVQNTIDTASLTGFLTRYRALGSTPFPSLCYIGGLDSSKRIEFVLEVADEVVKTIRNLRFRVAGDGAERDRVVRFCATRPWAEYAGYAGIEEKARILASSSMILNPGRIGLIAVDSLASGTPIATTQYAYHAPEFSYLIPSETVAVLPNNPHEFAAAVTKLLTNPYALQAMRNACLRDAEKFTIDRMVENYAGGVVAALNLARQAPT